MLAVLIAISIAVATGAASCFGAEANKLVLKKPLTIVEVLQTYGDSARAKVKVACNAANVQYPPRTSTWVALKEEKMLFVFAPDRAGKTKLVLSFPIIGASGVAGPKLREGDKQVPEGFYRLTRFRPNLVAHIGIEVDYPNAEDRVHARSAARSNLGGDIIIHGSRWSTGCLAMENAPIEQLFILATDVGLGNINLLFAPCDLTRTRPKVNYAAQPDWLPRLYDRLKVAMQALPIPG